MTVRCDMLDDIAVVTIDNPPVNALSTGVRRSLMSLAEELDADPSIRAIILLGAGKTFIGGADISEFDRALESPFMPDLVSRIERSAKPWIAAVQGAALGGGLELCLGCAYRIATPDARFALPEVNLGIIPGAGGTQRLARIIDPVTAVRILADDGALDAADALAAGLVDRIVSTPMRDAAIEFARQASGVSRPVAIAERPVAAHDDERLQQAIMKVIEGSKRSNARIAAMEALRHGMGNGIEAGLRFERQSFLALSETEEARALRYLFFAERAAPRPAFLRGVSPYSLRRVAVIGGGTMGVGIAAALRQAGLPAVLVERDRQSLERAIRSVGDIGDSLLKRGRLTVEQHAGWLKELSGAVGNEAAKDCDLVIEAVFEDVDVKRAVFAELAELCRADCILATNTSYIDPRRIFEGLPGRHRLIGMHFFSPAHVMRLMEIIPVPETAPKVLATAFDLARRLGKIPVRSGICDGFIGNRILRRYRSEAERLLREGIGFHLIDEAMRGFGYAMGPFEMQDLAGLDISYLQREAARKAGERVADTPGDLLVRAGRKGQKSGGGWYDYSPASRTPLTSADAAAIIAPMIGPAREMAPHDIVARLIEVMVDEGKAILDEGIAGCACDIDLVEVHGYGFPRARGGPMFQHSLSASATNSA